MKMYFMLGVVVGLFILTMLAGKMSTDLLSVSGKIALLKTLNTACMIGILSLPLYWTVTKMVHLKVFAPIFIVLLAFYGVVLAPSVNDEISKLKAQENIENTEENKLNKEQVAQKGK